VCEGSVVAYKKSSAKEKKKEEKKKLSERWFAKVIRGEKNEGGGEKKLTSRSGEGGKERTRVGRKATVELVSHY